LKIGVNEMATKQYDNYADLITFTRASTGTALRHVGYSPELVTNGTFDDGTTGWAAGSDGVLSVVSGQMNVSTVAPDTFATAYQIITTEVGKVYQLTATKISQDAVSAWGVSTSTSGARFADFSSSLVGTATLYFVAQGTQTYVQLGASGSGGTTVYDNVSVKEVIFDRATDPLVLFNHPTNTPRIEYDANGNRKGLLIEEARTNSIRNSVAGGAVVGSPGSLPTYWAVFGGTAATEIVATGTEAGVAYVDVRITGNPATGIFNFESSTQIPASEGESWSLNLNARIVAGDTTNVNELSPSINWRSSGAFLSRVTGEDFKDETNAGPRIVSGTAPATTDRVLPQIFVSCSGDVDFTLRVYAPQLEAGSFPTSYILTAGAAASRSADVASIPTSAFGFNPDKGTVVVGYQTFTSQGTTRIAELETDVSNRITLFQGATGEAPQLFANVANVSQADFVTGNTAISGINSVAATYAQNNFALTLNGGTVATDTSALVPVVDNLRIGYSNAAGSLNGHIKSIQYYPRRLTNAQLQELTA
jgi:hypothetical protein